VKLEVLMPDAAVDIAAGTATNTVPVTAVRRYTATAQALHWVVAVLMFSVVPLAWVMVNLPRTTPWREDLYTLHKSIGLTILTLVAVRLVWRATHPAPKLPGRMARWEQAAAFASHWLLYLILVGMPVSGYLLSAAGGNPVSYFGLFTLPGLSQSEELRQVALWTHVVTGQWAVYLLVVLHLIATVWHVAVRRDGVLDRMLPMQEEAP
jgi:cytochrome b561